MFCTNCGAKLSEQAKFCSECGQKVERSPTESPETLPPPEDQRLPEEGRSAAAKDTAGTAAGPEEGPAVPEDVREEDLPPEAPDPHLPSPEDKAGKKPLGGKKILAIAAAVIVVLAVILVAVLGTNGGQDPEPTQPPAEAPVAEEEEPSASLTFLEMEVDRYPIVDVSVAYTGEIPLSEETVSVYDGGTQCDILSLQAGGGKMTLSYRGQDVQGQEMSRTLSVIAAGDGDTYECSTTYTTPAYTPVQLELISSDVSEYPKVKAYFRVEDSSGAPISGLDAKSFTIRESVNGGAYLNREIRLAAMLEGNQGLNISLVADKSGSIHESDMNKIQDVMAQFVLNLDFAVGDTAEILAFDNVVQQMCRFTNESELLLNGIRSMRPYDRTALYDALYDGISHAAYQGGARCVLAFTDGLDNESRCTPEQVIDFSLTNQVPVYIVGVGNSVDENTLQEIAWRTNGYYWHIDDIYDLMQIYNQVYQEQQELYVVEYVSDVSLDEYLQRSLDVVVYGSGCHGNATVAFTPVQTTELSSHTSRYEVVKSSMTWEEANRRCQEMGGHLATVTSQSEFDEIVSLCEEAGLQSLWMGGYTSYDYDGQVFGHWVTGEAFTYQNWFPNEPSRSDRDGVQEYYIMLQNLPEYGGWRWNDQRNDPTERLPSMAQSMGFVCEYGD